WQQLGEIIQTWKGDLPYSQPAVDGLFRRFGPSFKLGAEMLYPPYRRCPVDGYKLSNKIPVYVKIYTLRRGIIPAYQVSLYCKGKPDSNPVNARPVTTTATVYKTQKPPTPFERAFFEPALCQLFTDQMCHAHTSATMISRIYNLNLAFLSNYDPEDIPGQLSNEGVWDAFFMHALLRRYKALNANLQLPHKGEQSQRLNCALDVANSAMAGTGQPEYAHACKQCFKITYDGQGKPNGYMNAGTMDGVTLGHPCCRVQYCKRPLHSMKDWFCPEHQ
ncbi:hypothetical protein V5O48_019165, partial [Marasmius crinis-equi]